VTGLCVHTTAAALGLSALLATSATVFVFTVVKLIGAAYLALLGVQALLAAHRDARTANPRQRPSAHEDQLNGSVPSRRRAYRQGLLTNVLNPKAALFFVSLLPQFLDRQAPVLPQTLLLSAVTISRR
jgi:threonine/homoserine/homoserine lactone efflux protein